MLSQPVITKIDKLYPYSVSETKNTNETKGNADYEG